MASLVDFGQFTRNYPFTDETGYDVQETVFENGDKQYRLINEQDHMAFVLNFFPLTLTESQDILDFFKARNGKYEAFKFTNPLDGKLYDVRFKESTMSRERIAYNTFRMRVSLGLEFPFGAYCVIDVNEDIAISEYNEMFDMALWLNEYESVSISEYANLFDITVEVGPVYESISMIESISMYDPIIELGINDAVSVAEYVGLFEILARIDVNDGISIVEDDTIGAPA